PDLASAGTERRLEDQGPFDVVAELPVVGVLWFHRAESGLVPVEQAPEAAARIESRQAAPVDGPLPGDQRGRVAVGDETVVADRRVLGAGHIHLTWFAGAAPGGYLSGEPANRIRRLRAAGPRPHRRGAPAGIARPSGGRVGDRRVGRDRSGADRLDGVAGAAPCGGRPPVPGRGVAGGVHPGAGGERPRRPPR